MGEFSFKKLFENKIIKYALITLIVAIIIIIFSIIFNNKNNNKTTVNNYVSSLETNLEKRLKKIEGVGKVDVMLTISTFNEQDIAKKTITTTFNGKTETITEPILINGEPIILKEYPPKITGVLIICDGADDFMVLYKIQSVTTTLLDVDINDIEILKMK
jgi:stage III sporulation protein AG